VVLVVLEVVEVILRARVQVHLDKVILAEMETLHPFLLEAVVVVLHLLELTVQMLLGVLAEMERHQAFLVYL